MVTSEHMNTRILVIDDEESVRDSFESVLLPDDHGDTSRVTAAAATLFGLDAVAETPGAARRLVFDLDVAKTGAEGIRMAREAHTAGRPYALIFCDIRMPGIDGVAAVEEIRTFDPRVEVVFVTAYSDHSVEAICARAGANVGYFVKPFLSDEVRQLSTKLILDWNRARELEELMVRLSSLGAGHKDMEWLLRFMLRQICVWLDTSSAVLLTARSLHQYEYRLGVGDWTKSEHAQELVQAMQEKGIPTDEVSTVANCTVLPVRDFGLAVALTGEQKVTPDREFMLRVFVEHAALAIQHAEAAERLVRTERMEVLGEALSFTLHDLRAPIGVAKMRTAEVRRLQPELSEEARLNLDKLDHNLDKSLNMLNDIVDFAKGHVSVSPQCVPLLESFEDLISEWTWVLQQRGNIELRAEIPADLEACIDLPKLRRCVINLFNNAAQVLETKPNPVIEFGAREEGGHLKIWVADNGPGIKEEDLDALLSPLDAKNHGAAVGFGLPIVRQVVEAHGGTLRLQPRELGACIELSFPLSTQTSPSSVR